MREGAKPRDGGRSSHFERRQHFTKQVWLMVLLGWLMLAGHAKAALQFDVYLGYDGMVREVNWFPAAFEIFNDGPAFNGVIELTNEQSGKGQARRVLVELPTNTRKRIVIPVFASAGKYAQWRAVLYDDKEKKRAEVKNLTMRRDINWNGILVGAITWSFGGQPVMPELANGRKDEGLEVARLDPNLLPDNPIPLEGLSTIYLNSQRALDISAPQGAALVSWLHGGGHLIVAVEQPGDLNGLPWLAPLMPVRFGGSQAVAAGRELENFAWTGWGVNLQNYQGTGKKREANQEFYEAKLPVFQATLSDGKTLALAGSLPLVVQAERGRGKLTVLTFSPEREPFRSWKGRHWFWAQLAGVPAAWFTDSNNNQQIYYNYTSIDGPIGAMIDSKQVRKLPVSWLLLLLAVYLVVIGPLDQWWLKKINRQMLTWITFPCYVVGFSLLIYWIGFLLRAGESEWNEVHLVDVTSYGGKVDLRGRTYASCYSPSNAKYPVAVDVPHATFRGEFQGSWSSPQELSRTEVTQLGKGFAAEVFVPVWTSQLYVSDWLEQGAEPLQVTIDKSGNNYTIRLENKLKQPLQNTWLVINDRVHDLPRLAAGERRQVTVPVTSGQSLSQFVQQNTANFSAAASRRKDAFGDSRRDYLPNPPVHLAAASYLNELPSMGNHPHHQRSEFILPGGFDLSDGLKQGQACVLAWVGGYSPIAALNKFESRRASRDTLFRVQVPAPK